MFSEISLTFIIKRRQTLFKIMTNKRKQKETKKVMGPVLQNSGSEMHWV